MTTVRGNLEVRKDSKINESSLFQPYIPQATRYIYRCEQKLCRTTRTSSNRGQPSKALSWFNSYPKARKRHASITKPDWWLIYWKWIQASLFLPEDALACMSLLHSQDKADWGSEMLWWYEYKYQVTCNEDKKQLKWVWSPACHSLRPNDPKTRL